MLDTQPDATPSGILTVADLQERSRNHAHESQILLSGVMKSVTVGNAAYTLVMLAGSSVSPLLWIPFWIDTFATIIVSFTQQITGSLLSTFVPDWRETTIVFSEALWEFMMMSTLMPRGSSLPMLSSWYVVAGLHAVFGVLAMQNLRSKLASGRYSPALGGLSNPSVLDSGATCLSLVQERRSFSARESRPATWFHACPHSSDGR